MPTAEQRLTDRAPGAGRRRDALTDLAAGLVPALAAVGGTWWLLGLPASYALLGVVLYGALAGTVLWSLPARLPGPGLGAANRVTLGRAVVALPVFALAAHPVGLGTPGQWAVVVLSTGVLLLDGLDGRVARRTGTETAFGARFDMELDAALLLALSVIVWRSGKVGAWVLAIGLMRYAFVAAGRVWPALAAELPPSLRRKVVCVVQGVVLLVALGPIIPSWTAVTVTAGGLAALIWSFAVDVGWSLRQDAPPPTRP